MISVIVPTCARPADLRTCLDALCPQLPADGSIEILVTDDSPDDATHAMMDRDYPALGWQPGPRRGPAANRNRGARAARGAWIVFIDDDCVPRPTLLAAYQREIAALEGQTETVLEGATHRSSGSPSLLWESPHKLQAGHSLISCNLAISRALFDRSGGFDERYPDANFEDTEFSARLDLLGARHRFVENAIVDHPLRPLPPASRLAQRWEARVISTYDFGASTPQVLRFLPRHILLVILSRFRNHPVNRDNLAAGVRFSGEMLIVLMRLPGWIQRHRNAPRSAFWTEQCRLGKAPPKWGL